MKQNNSNNDTIKWIILIVIAVEMGTFISNIFGNMEVNIWFARTIGALVTVIVTLLLHRLLIKRTEK
jgi:hypothetical protein